MQERSVERLRDDLIVTNQQEIGGPGLMYVPVRAKQHLIDAEFRFRIQRRP